MLSLHASPRPFHANTERQRQIMAYEQQQQQQEAEAAAAEAAAAQGVAQQSQQQQSAGEGADFPEEMYKYLDMAQGDAAFVEAVQAGADAYMQERQARGQEAADRLWEDQKAYLDMTFLK